MEVTPPEGTCAADPVRLYADDLTTRQLIGFGEYFGVGPHYRWINDGGVAEHSMLTRVRKIPEGQNSEDVMRALAGEDRADRSWNNKPDVMDYLYDQLEKNPDIEGIVGYSEGASVAASFIMDEEKRCQDTGRARRIKCALFFTGWPPISPDNKLILADEDERMIDIPTLHVVGANGTFTSIKLCNRYLPPFGEQTLTGMAQKLCTMSVIPTLQPCLIQGKDTRFRAQAW